ncbi:MAG: efflux RND transporter periplasmic adaptor subunit [Flavobacteriales bacterium]|nr:Macrolide export protein MacA [Flavobacteriales bacterium]MCC6577554.1 efflux RND transporter periplasmic adaptor subunit [Flavobacteriales bacterium]NUQ16317.1 efflux RND transporter periplasmic adaptor subunit [Flavobacteriales bacterium]
MKKILKYLLFSGLAVLFVWTMYFLYRKSASRPDEFKVEKPARNNVVKKTVANGKMVPRKEILIKPVVSGIIAELFVEAGDEVKRDQPLAKIKIVPDMLSLSNAENRVRNAEIAQQNARLNFDRNKPLADKGVISAAEMQTFDVALKNADQEVAAAREALQVVRDGISRSSAGNTVVRSTIDGMVLDVPVKEGNSVIERNNFNEGTTIAAIADMNDLIFQGKVDESEVGKVKLGMPVVLTVGAIENARWDADLEYIAPKGVEENGAIQFEIRAAVKLKEGQSLRSGYSANADIVLERRDSVLTVPESIVEFNDKGDSAFVFVRKPGGQGEEAWQRTYIRTGLSDGINLEVLDGVDANTELKGAKVEPEGPAGGMGPG